MKIFGIDQTGATLTSTKPKPLKACELILNSKNEIIDICFFEISHIGQWIKDLNIKEKNHIFVDCVLGLPIELNAKNPTHSLRDWISSAGLFSLKGKQYGMDVSKKFFNRIKLFYKIKNSNIPQRKVEIKLNSNSVFSTFPFQKNIQTGTFRIWKELSHCLEDIIIWPTDFYLKDEFNITLYEVYPSYLYKILFNSKYRSHNPLLKYLYNNKVSLSDANLHKIMNSDYCDALISALGGRHFMSEKDLWSTNCELIFFEGDILGS